MIEQDLLSVLAEISVSLAGFASLLVAIRRGGSDKWFPESMGMLATIGWSFGALFFSLLPLLFFHLGLSPNLVWGLSSGLLALFIVGFVCVLTFLASKLSFRIPAKAKIVRGLILASSLIQIGNAGDAVICRSGGYYLMGIILLLLFGSVPILLIIANIIRHDLQ